MKRYLGRNKRTGALSIVDAVNPQQANDAFQGVPTGDEEADEYEIVCVNDYYDSPVPQVILGPNIA